MRDPGSIPCATAALDLDHPLQGIDLGRAPSGEPYRALLALVRLHGDPLAAVEVPLIDGRIGSAELAERIVSAARDRLEAHVRAHDCLDAAALTPEVLSGDLTCRQCPPLAVDPQSGPFVTVIVSTVGRSRSLVACIASLAAMAYPRFEVLVVDNAPHDSGVRDVVDEAARAGAPVRYAAEPIAGLSFARNRGIRESSGEILAFTDDDVCVDPEWLTWIVGRFADERVGAVTGLVMPARLETAEQRSFERLGGFSKGLDARVYDTGENRASEQLLFPYWGARFGSGNSMAFRRRVLDRMGGFDPALGAGSPALGGEDLASFSQVILGGSRLVYEPRAVCWHDDRVDEAALRRQTFSYAVACTAVLTRWIARDPRLLWQLLSRVGAGLVCASGERGGSTDAPPEIRRLLLLLQVNRREGRLGVQLGGFLAGPALYLRSVLRVWGLRVRHRSTRVRHRSTPVRVR